MSKPDRFFFERYGLTEGDLEKYLAEALSQGGEYADLYFEHTTASSIMGGPFRKSCGCIAESAASLARRDDDGILVPAFEEEQHRERGCWPARRHRNLRNGPLGCGQWTTSRASTSTP